MKYSVTFIMLNILVMNNSLIHGVRYKQNLFSSLKNISFSSLTSAFGSHSHNHPPVCRKTIHSASSSSPSSHNHMPLVFPPFTQKKGGFPNLSTREDFLDHEIAVCGLLSTIDQQYTMLKNNLFFQSAETLKQNTKLLFNTFAERFNLVSPTITPCHIADVLASYPEVQKHYMSLYHQNIQHLKPTLLHYYKDEKVEEVKEVEKAMKLLKATIDDVIKMPPASYFTNIQINELKDVRDQIKENLNYMYELKKALAIQDEEE